MTTDAYLEEEKAARLSELARWSNSILVDEKQARSLIHLLFETAGAPSDQAVLNLSNAIDGLERQVDTYADSLYGAYPQLEAEQQALELHYDTVRQLRELFQDARAKNATTFWALDADLVSRFAEIATAGPLWIASIPEKVAATVSDAAEAVAVGVSSAAQSVKDTVTGAFGAVTEPVNNAIKYAPWILGGIALVLVVGMVAYARVLNSVTGGKG